MRGSSNNHNPMWLNLFFFESSSYVLTCGAPYLLFGQIPVQLLIMVQVFHTSVLEVFISLIGFWSCRDYVLQVILGSFI